MKQILLILATMSVLTGCMTSTQITSFRDPDFKDKSYDCMIIVSNDPNPIFKQAIETNMSNKLSGYGVRGLVSTAIFPPTRTLPTESELAKILNGVKCDAFLLLAVTGGQREVSYFANQTGGANPLATTRMTAEARILDVKTESKVWVANANIAHHTTFTWTDGVNSMIESATSELLNKLIEDNLLKVPQQ